MPNPHSVVADCQHGSVLKRKLTPELLLLQEDWSAAMDATSHPMTTWSSRNVSSNYELLAKRVELSTTGVNRTGRPSVGLLVTVAFRAGDD